MPSLPQTSLAIVAVVAVPVLVGQVTQPAARTPPPGRVALVANLTSDESEPGDRARLRVLASGAPPARAVVLTNPGGTTAVTATAVDLAACRGLRARRATEAPDDATEWCLQLEHVGGGDSGQGTLAGDGTELALTVNRRVSPGWAMLAAAVGIAVGFATLLAAPWLRRRVRPLLLSDLLADNEAAGADRIVGLEDWIVERREADAREDELVPVVAQALRNAPGIARRARRALGEALGRTTLAPGHPFVRAASAEAASTRVAVDDFDLADGAIRGPHRAIAYLQTLEKLEQQAGELNAAAHTLEQQIKSEGDCRTEPEAKRREASAAFQLVAAPGEEVALRTAIDAFKRALAVALDRQECLHEGARTLTAAAPATEAPAEAAGAGAGAPPPEPPQTAAAGKARGTGRLKLWSATILFAGLVVAWALLGLWTTVYEPKPAFGSTADWAALAIAAVGSGAAGAVFGLLSVWDTDGAADAG